MLDYLFIYICVFIFKYFTKSVSFLKGFDFNKSFLTLEITISLSV
jgi:hypothetical protein